MSAVVPDPKNWSKFIAMLRNGANAGQLANRLLQIAGSLAVARIYARYLLEWLKRPDVQKKILKYVFYTAVVGVSIALLANPLALAGFGGGGVIAGSAAAAWQATIGNVVAGSLFAGLQSFAMTSAPVLLPILGASMLTALGVSKAEKIKSRARQFGRWVRGIFRG